MLQSLELLAKDLSRVEMGGGVSVQQEQEQEQEDTQSIRSFDSFDSTLDGPKQLDAYLNRGNREVLNILKLYSPVKTTKIPLIPRVPEEEEEEEQPTEAVHLLSFSSDTSVVPRLPKISALTKIERKNISRLPKANQHDLLLLGEINEQFIANNQIDVSLTESSLYQKLKASRRVDEEEFTGNSSNNTHHHHQNHRRANSRTSPSRQARRRSSTATQNSRSQSISGVAEQESKTNTAENETKANTTEAMGGDFNGAHHISNEDHRITSPTGPTSPVAELQKELKHSFGRRRQITHVIDDQMRRDRLELPLEFILQVKDKEKRTTWLRERATIAIVYLLKNVLKRRKAQYLKRWRDFNMYFERNRIVHAAKEITRVAKGKIGRMEAVERRKQRAIQIEAERQRQAELAQLRFFSARQIQRVMRGWRHRGFAARAKLRRDASTCIQCFTRFVQANIRVKNIRRINKENFEGAAVIQRAYRCSVARVLYGLKRRIRRAENAVLYAKKKTEEVRLRFEAKGAANLISRWWRMLKVRMQFLRYRKLNKGRRVLKIQCSYRCYRGRIELTARKLAHKDWLESRNKAASYVQALYRRNKEKDKVRAMRAVIAAADGERKKRIEEANQDKIKTFKLVGEVNMTKLHQRLFAVRKVIDPFGKSRQLKAAVNLQRYFRGNRARKRIRLDRMNHHLFLRKKKKMDRDAAALKLQTRYRSKVLRRKFLAQVAKKAAIMVQKTWRAYKGRMLAMGYLQETYSCRNIQRIWRGYIGREHSKQKKIERQVLGSKVQGFQNIARKFLARQKVERMKERLRYLEEVGLMGKEEFRVCRAHLRDVLMLDSFRFTTTRRGATSKGSGIALELFEALCSGGRKKVHTDDKTPQAELRIGNTVLSRMCNDSHIIDEKRVKRNTVGILFAKAKAQNNDKLNFAEFSTFLRSLAKVRYPKVDKLRQVKDGQAQMLTLLCDHLLGGDKPKAHRRQLRTKLFRKMAKALDHQTDSKIAKLATRMQAGIRGVQCRHKFAKLMLDHNELVEHERLERAARLIEAHIRKIFARKGAQKLASKTIQKFVDPVSKEAYYYNPKTGVTSWDKPDILGQRDVLDPQVLPDKSIEFVVMCANCDKAVAESFCMPCGDGYCDDCFKSKHRKGNKQKHLQTPIPRCHSCMYQAASRRLVGANKTKRTSIHAKAPKNAPKTQFCDSCYEHRRHTELREAEENQRVAPPSADWVVQPCAECEERSCRWKCLDCDDFYCTKCFSHVHARGNRASHSYIMLSYYTVEMERVRMNALRENRQKEAEAIRLAQLRLAKDFAGDRIAGWGQARFRGNKGREYGLPFLKQGRAELRRMYRVKKKEDVIRKQIGYKLKDVIGAAPILESDDAATVARKKRAFLHDPKANIKHRLKQAVIFEMPKWMIGKALPGTVIVRKREAEAECDTDLTVHLKRGDRIRVGMGIFTIPIDGGFRRPDPDLDNLEPGGDVDPDTGLVKADPPRFNHLFLPLGRPWAVPTEEGVQVFKLSSARPKAPPTDALGKAWESISFLVSDESVVKQLVVASKTVVQTLVGKVCTKVGKKTGGYVAKMGDFWTTSAEMNASRSIIQPMTIDPLELDKRLWSTTMDDSSGKEYYTNRMTREVTWEKPFSMLDMYEKREFKAREQEEQARLDEIAGQKANAELKKKEREMIKKAKEKRKKRR